jgi:NAD(P)-dependent dehydrogenase (short-subunit alcohol dehydrogenase family)
MKGLAGRAVLVTGAASGIGRAAAARLVAEGAAVALLDRDGAQVDAAASALAENGGRTVALAADVAVEAAVREAVARAADTLGGLGGVVTSAGIFDPGDYRPTHEVELDTFLGTLGVNLVGTFLVVKYALPHLLARGGAIVTIASTAALRAHGIGAGYTASKGGVVALTRLLAAQYGARGVRANCVCPGITATGMTGHVARDPEYLRKVTPRIPLRRIAEAEEIGAVACHLLSDDASYVNGQIIAADGGATVL